MTCVTLIKKQDAEGLRAWAREQNAKVAAAGKPSYEDVADLTQVPTAEEIVLAATTRGEITETQRLWAYEAIDAIYAEDAS